MNYFQWFISNTKKFFHALINALKYWKNNEFEEMKKKKINK